MTGGGDAELSDKHSEEPEPLIVLLCADLMLTSSVSGAARMAGVRFVSRAQVAAAAAELATSARRRLFVDLGTPGLVISQLVELISADDLRNAVAYGPHVHETLLQAASDAGIGTVLSRGQFSSQYSRLIADWA